MLFNRHWQWLSKFIFYQVYFWDETMIHTCWSGRAIVVAFIHDTNITCYMLLHISGLPVSIKIGESEFKSCTSVYIHRYFQWKYSIVNSKLAQVKENVFDLLRKSMLLSTQSYIRKSETSQNQYCLRSDSLSLAQDNNSPYIYLICISIHQMATTSTKVNISCNI